MDFAHPAEILSKAQLALGLFVGTLYLARALLRGGQMDDGLLFRIVSAAASAAILPFVGVIIYCAFNPAALEWVSRGDFRMSFLVLGVGALVYAVANIKNNWPG